MDPMNRYVDAANRGLIDLWKVSNSPNWKYVRQLFGISIHSFPSEDGSVVSMGVGEIEGDPKEILSYLTDTRNRLKWDPLFDSFKLISSVSECTWVEQRLFKPLWVILCS
jgi:hypothetical protein